MSVKYVRDNLGANWEDEEAKTTDGASEKLRVRMEADSYNSTDQTADGRKKRGEQQHVCARVRARVRTCVRACVLVCM